MANPIAATATVSDRKNRLSSQTEKIERSNAHPQQKRGPSERTGGHGPRLSTGGPDIGGGDDPGNDRAGDQDEAKAQHGNSFLMASIHRHRAKTNTGPIRCQLSLANKVYLYKT
jgi:hypothetical protein